MAGWISTSGWAAAAERELGHAWIVTRDGVRSSEAVRAGAARAVTGPAGPVRRARRWLPVPMKTLAKDVREAGRARRFRVPARGPWDHLTGDLAFVWQRHELFHRAGLQLADDLGVPSVLFVPALHVWQAERWAVGRPGWGRWLERRAEAPALHAATLVACGSDLVAEQVQRLGVPDERLLVTPTGVDLMQFAGDGRREETRRALGLADQFVVGWTGSFRGFHRLEHLVEAAAGAAGTTLLLVGDGPERSRIEQHAARAGVRAVFTGMVPHDDLPGLLAAMDVGVVLAAPGEPFHYSPLKLAEYLAAGLPVVAPDVEQLAGRLHAGVDAELYPAGDLGALASVLGALRSDPERRRRLGEAARRASSAWSWDHQVRRVCDALAAAPT